MTTFKRVLIHTAVVLAGFTTVVTLVRNVPVKSEVVFLENATKDDLVEARRCTYLTGHTETKASCWLPNN